MLFHIFLYTVWPKNRRNAPDFLLLLQYWDYKHTTTVSIFFKCGSGGLNMGFHSFATTIWEIEPYVPPPPFHTLFAITSLHCLIHLTHRQWRHNWKSALCHRINIICWLKRFASTYKPMAALTGSWSWNTEFTLPILKVYWKLFKYLNIQTKLA